jgi:hypothetical protein
MEKAQLSVLTVIMTLDSPSDGKQQSITTNTY